MKHLPLAHPFLLLLAIGSSSAKYLKGRNKNEESEEIAQLSFQDIMREKRQGEEDVTFTIVTGELPSDKFCWLHENGKFCFEGNNFQSVTKMEDDLYYEEFLNGKKYSYSLPNTDKLRDDLQSIPSSSGNKKIDHALSNHGDWLDSIEGVKFGCQVEVLGGSFYFDVNNKEVLTTNGDGSSIWKFQDWIVNVDSNMIPINIMVPPTSDAKGYEFLAAIDSIESFTESFEGCDPDTTDGNESLDVTPEGRERLLSILDAHDPSISEEEYFSQEEEGKRRLVPNFVTNLSASISNTQWCGPGTNKITTPCPDKNKKFDFNADNACRRHDHGKKYVITWIGLPRLECVVDRDLRDAGGHNWAVSAAYGNWGGTQVIGCFNYKSYKCWKRNGWKVSYGNCGKKWFVKNGPLRYNNISKQDGYKARQKFCPYDGWLNWS